MMAMIDESAEGCTRHCASPFRPESPFRPAAWPGGKTYHYRLVAKNRFGVQSVGQGHTFTTPGKTSPLVSTGGASDISQNSATLSGTVNPEGR